MTLDGGQPVSFPFGTCDARSCVASAVLAENVMAAFKAGKVLNVSYTRTDTTKAELPLDMESLAVALETIAPE